MPQEAQKDTSKDMEESKKGEKKKEISVLTSKSNRDSHLSEVRKQCSQARKNAGLLELACS